MMKTKGNNSPVTPIKFATISKLYVEINKLLSTRISYTTISLEGLEWQFKLNLSTDNVKPCFLGLAYTINDTEIIFNISKDFLQQLIPNELDVEAIMNLPVDLKSAVVANAMHLIIDTLKSRLGVNIIFNKICEPEKFISNENISINISSDTFETNLYISLSNNLIGLLKILPKNKNINNLNIPYFIKIEMGSSSLTKLETSNLELEDIIFIRKFPKKNQYFIRINRYILFVGEVSNNKLTIKSRVEQMDTSSHSDDEYNEEQHDEKTEIDENDIELNVIFEVGQQQINMSEISKISLDYIFDLDVPASNPIKVIVNGKHIADSELVEIENRLGARITKLY